GPRGRRCRAEQDGDGERSDSAVHDRDTSPPGELSRSLATVSYRRLSIETSSTTRSTLLAKRARARGLNSTPRAQDGERRSTKATCARAALGGAPSVFPAVVFSAINGSRRRGASGR